MRRLRQVTKIVREQLSGTELMLEFIGDAEEGLAAPRLAQARPDPDTLRDLWAQLVEALTTRVLGP